MTKLSVVLAAAGMLLAAPSRCTRSPSLRNMSRMMPSSAMTLSISTTDAPETRSITELMFSTAASLVSCCLRQNTDTSRRTKARISPSTCSTAAVAAAVA